MKSFRILFWRLAICNSTSPEVDPHRKNNFTGPDSQTARAAMNNPETKKYVAEAIGTFVLVFAGTGAIVINDVTAGSVSHVGIALTFGLAVMTMIYSVGDVSGAHFNPAVTIGFFLAKRLEARSVAPYILSQLAGAFAASLALRLMFPAHPIPGHDPAVRQRPAVVCAGGDPHRHPDVRHPLRLHRTQGNRRDGGNRGRRRDRVRSDLRRSDQRRFDESRPLHRPGDRLWPGQVFVVVHRRAAGWRGGRRPALAMDAIARSRRAPIGALRARADIC